MSPAISPPFLAEVLTFCQTRRPSKTPYTDEYHRGCQLTSPVRFETDPKVLTTALIDHVAWGS